ncbi:hypothetical protein R6Q57_029567 [Mikania cordata]
MVVDQVKIWSRDKGSFKADLKWFTASAKVEEAVLRVDFRREFGCGAAVAAGAQIAVLGWSAGVFFGDHGAVLQQKTESWYTTGDNHKLISFDQKDTNGRAHGLFLWQKCSNWLRRRNGHEIFVKQKALNRVTLGGSRTGGSMTKKNKMNRNDRVIFLKKKYRSLNLEDFGHDRGKGRVSRKGCYGLKQRHVLTGTVTGQRVKLANMVVDQVKIWSRDKGSFKADLKWFTAILHTPGKNNKNVRKALIAAEYIPVLETPDGPLFESNAIARYGEGFFGRIEQWIDFSSFELDANITGWVYPRFGIMTYFKPAEENCISGLKRGLDALNTHLASHTFLVGDGITLADIITTCNLLMAFQYLMTKSFTSEYPHVERYFWTMVNQPNFSKVIGEVKQAEAVIPIPSAKKPESKPKPEPKKEVKKEEAPKPQVQSIEEEEAPKPKPKNPLDLLPPSKMILDDWKRLYSNTKTNFREVAIKGFWEMFDPEGYSLWFCNYKYNDENNVSFVTMNKVGGFLQRMDLARKYAFGKMLIIGNEAPFKVKGLWLFRGQEIPKFVMDECYDMDLYEWTKVDISDEAQKERVNQMIEDQEPFEGEALLDAKCFK